MKRKHLTSAVATALLIVGQQAKADVLHFDDVIITGSECVGFGCADGEVFSYDTIRLKEDNTRIGFSDTSTAVGFPTNDWEITINDTTSGGDNYFAVTDITGSKVPFKLQAGAPSNSLFVESSGDVGIGTATPALELSIKDSDTPGIRLEQDNSGGWSPQTWDVSGNETNFFIRDVTNGSKLPFRIKPGAPSSSVFIDADGDVGLGTASPEWAFHVKRSGVVINQTESSDNGAVQVRFKTDSANRRFVAVNSSGTVKSQFIFADDEIKLAGKTDSTNLFATFNGTGLTVNGSISTTASGQVHPDYVFKPEYKLMPLDSLKAFVDENSHLPEIPSAADVAKEGINMSDLQVLLLKKVEELTLYTIQQQQTIDSLAGKLAKLEGSVNK